MRLALIGDKADHRGYAKIASRLEGVSLTNVSLADAGETLQNHSGDFDAAAIHSAGSRQEELALLAVAAEKHVLLETPAVSLESARRLQTACEAANVRWMLGQSSRFLPSMAEVKASVCSGRLGEPGLLRVHRWAPSDSAELPGGRCLWREIDLACWLFESLPTSVYALDNPSAAYVQLHLGFPNDAMALLDFCGSLPAGDDYFSLSLIGSTGAAYADDHHNRQLVYRGGRAATLGVGQGSLDLLAQLQKFQQAIERQQTPSVADAEQQTILQVLAAAEQSLANNQAVSLTNSEATP